MHAMFCLSSFMQPKLFSSAQTNNLNSADCHSSFTHLLETRCRNLGDVAQIHAQMIVTGFIRHQPSISKLISLSFSTKQNPPNYAIAVFDQIDKPDVLVWNTMIRTLVNHNFPEIALSRFVRMLEESSVDPDRFTFPSLLKACTQLFAYNEGKILHGQIVKFCLNSDVYTESTLINMYMTCGDISSARILFDKISERKNQVVWTSMINGYFKNHKHDEALLLFGQMEREGLEIDEVTMASMVSVCAELRLLDYGKKLHFQIKKRGMDACVVLITALINMYSKCGELDLARKLFDVLPERNVVSWTAMISGYAQNNKSKDALKLFAEMINEENQNPNEITILSVLSACAQSGNLEIGKWIHLYANRTWRKFSTNLQNSLIDMYSKCGKIDIACQVFDEMVDRDVVSWNSIITGLALHGLGQKSLLQFSNMQKDGYQPDDITFIGVISACSHAGLVEEGCRYFKDMNRVYGITPKVEHFGCMVDLLCRAGLLNEAENFIKDMPMKPNGAVWGALLSACRVYNNVELGEKATKHLLDIEPLNDGVYVLLSNLYAGRKQWEKVEKVRTIMHKRGITKTPGCSSIAVNGVIHEFLVGDHSHPESENIYSMLDYVMTRIKAFGYVSQTSEVLLNIDEEDKEDFVSKHSEKLAICYGLMKLKPDEEILIMKNLRICVDCHSATKFISKVFLRNIIIRDRSRFHHFKEGSCSCRDYW